MYFVLIKEEQVKPSLACKTGLSGFTNVASDLTGPAGVNVAQENGGPRQSVVINMNCMTLCAF